MQDSTTRACIGTDGVVCIWPTNAAKYPYVLHPVPPPTPVAGGSKMKGGIPVTWLLLLAKTSQEKVEVRFQICKIIH